MGLVLSRGERLHPSGERLHPSLQKVQLSG